MTDGFISINGDNQSQFNSGYDSMIAVAPQPELVDIEPVPDFRGYAALGTGQYLLNACPATEVLPAELVISIATEEEKAGRVIGDLKDVEPGTEIDPSSMAVRLAFFSVSGLDALEQQLRILREESFPSTTPKPDRTAELEQLRQRVAELEKERDELKLVVSAHADFFSRTQSEMADLKESVECLSATNDFLTGKRDENIILKAAVKQLTAERDAALNEARDFESDIDTVTQHNVELQLETIALKSALNVARDGIDEFLVANDPTEFGCACDLSVGYLCGPCHADKQQEPLKIALAKINEVLKP